MQKVGFMTANPDKYKQLARFPELVSVIRQQEDAINARETTFIAIANVEAIEKDLKTGDILGFTTSKSGLDTSHTGMIWRGADGKVGVLHASSSKKAVVFEPDLGDFTKGFATGLMIGRPLEP
jgi:hypothetical protein